MCVCVCQCMRMCMSMCWQILMESVNFMKEAMNVTLAEAGCLLHETAICLQWVTSLCSIITSNDGANSDIS